MARKQKGKDGIVYSTNPDFDFEQDAPDIGDFPSKQEQQLKIQLRTKNRGGKTVTVVYGFDYPDEEIGKIGKELKKYCGTGGAYKDGEIIIQGDFRTKAQQWLKKEGFSKARII